MDRVPLRYNISDLRQLPKCLSNNSRELHLRVGDVIGMGGNLTGLKITLEHEYLGVLFAHVCNARGSIITSDPNTDPHELTPQQILDQLEKYGYYITYDPRKALSGDQLQFLMTLNGFHFDKIRKLVVNYTGFDTTDYRVWVVAFNATELPDWLNNAHVATKYEFETALSDGNAMNVTTLSGARYYAWDWLDYVASIDDIIADNAEV